MYVAINEETNYVAVFKGSEDFADFLGVSKGTIFYNRDKLKWKCGKYTAYYASYSKVKGRKRGKYS